MSTKNLSHRRPSTQHSAIRAMILVVDDEKAVLDKTRAFLEEFRMTVVTAQSTAEALQLIGSVRIDLALVDWRLKGSDDGMALGRLLLRDYGIPFVLFSGYLTTDATNHANRLGAADVVDKPLRPGRLLAAVNLALQQGRSPVDTAALSIRSGSDSVTQRWATFVLSGCRAEKDPNTEPAAANAATVSTSVYRKTCKACGVSGQHTRDLTRLLRAWARSKEDGSMLRIHLCSDPRTVAGLFGRAGLPLDARSISLRSFLIAQKLIPMTKECMRELAHRAANDALFFLDFQADDTEQKDGRKKV